nr:MAG TPA: hypothetical protein [Caudoviricetes sp.]
MIEWAKKQTDELYSILEDRATDRVLKKWSRLLKCDTDRTAIVDAASREHLTYESDYTDEWPYVEVFCNIDRIAVFVTARQMHIDEEFAECVVVKKAIDDAAKLGKSASDVYTPDNSVDEFFNIFTRHGYGLHLGWLIPEEENRVYCLGPNGADVYTRY